MFSPTDQQAAAQGATPTAPQGPPTAQQGDPTTLQADPRLLEYTTFSSDNVVILVHATNSKGLRCTCGARFGANVETQHLLKSVKAHLGICYGNLEFDSEALVLFLNQVTVAAKASAWIDVPFRFDLALGQALPDSLTAQLIEWCLNCGKTFGKSKSTDCECKTKRRITLKGLVKQGKSRMAPIPIGFPNNLDEKHLVLSKLYPAQDLHTQMVKQQSEILVLKSKLHVQSPAVGVAGPIEAVNPDINHLMQDIAAAQENTAVAA